MTVKFEVSIDIDAIAYVRSLDVKSQRIIRSHLKSPESPRSSSIQLFKIFLCDLHDKIFRSIHFSRNMRFFLQPDHYVILSIGQRLIKLYCRSIEQSAFYFNRHTCSS